MLNTAESQALIGIVDNRNVPYETLNNDWKEAVDALKDKRMVEVKNGLVNASSDGVTLVKIFKSGLDFNTMLRRIPFRTFTKLLYLSFNKCAEDGVHLNVIFKNMPQSQLDMIKQEISLAEQAKT